MPITTPRLRLGSTGLETGIDGVFDLKGRLLWRRCPKHNIDQFSAGDIVGNTIGSQNYTVTWLDSNFSTTETKLLACANDIGGSSAE